jgi:hypothetical protein
MRYASINDQKWQNWTDDFMTKTRKVPMTKEQSENFLMCVMPEQRPDLLARFTEECERNGKGMFPIEMWNSHAKRLSLDCNATVKVFFAASGLAGNAGTLVMYVHVCRRLQQIHGRRVTMDDITAVFPYGFPAPEEVHRMWDAQKRDKDDGLFSAMGTDNYLDCVVDMPSEDNSKPAGVQ